MSAEDFEVGLDQNQANYAALTPLTFLDWSADIYPDRLAVIHGERRYTWQQTRERCRRLACALADLGIGSGDAVAVLLFNTPEMIEAHFGVPMAGAVLTTINTRLDPATVGYILAHSESKVLIVDRALSAVAEQALAEFDRVNTTGLSRPIVIDVADTEYVGPGEMIGRTDYEHLLSAASEDVETPEPQDEWQAIALNYTSGTTGRPKGVVYHHRGAYLNAVSNIITWGMPRHSVYLWTLPMFHCNGWCFPWTMAANAGTNVCLRTVQAGTVFELISQHGVTHYCGAPIVHSMLIDHPPSKRPKIEHTVHGLIAAAPPPVSVIEGMEAMGFDLTHVYGLTETYGPASVCAKHDHWNDLDAPGRAERNGRQGVRILMQQQMTVIDAEDESGDGDQVPMDGDTIGEIVYRGNIVMKGYFKDRESTAKAFRGGWFHSGDLAVLQPDGYAKIRDRAKDVIISGGENISSVEIEDVLYGHPAVSMAAVVAHPDPTWGEVPWAYLELKPDAEPGEALTKELVEFCRDRMARFKVPKRFLYTVLPKTSTGKIQKNVLREQSGAQGSFDA